MKPRDDNPAKYRDNVRKSWLIMHEVVRQIKNDCFIAHLEPNVGVGYDCLSLVASDTRGYKTEDFGILRSKFLLNRNGQNGFVGDKVIYDIWETSDTTAGIKKLANDLIEVSGLSRLDGGESKSVMARVCSAVTKWIGEQPDDDFCVAPPGWPGGCRKFEPSCNFPDRNDDTLWPTHLGEPYLSLGVGQIEVARVRMTDASIKYSETEARQEMYTETEKKRKKFGTNYLAAIDAWGGFKAEPGVVEKVMEIVKFTENEFGAVSLAYFVDSRQYVAIRFTKDASLGIVFINKGFVDHRIKIPDSVWNKTHKIWRTELPTSKNSAATHKKLPEITQTLCRKCQMNYPAHLSGCPTCTDA